MLGNGKASVDGSKLRRLMPCVMGSVLFLDGLPSCGCKSRSFYLPSVTSLTTALQANGNGGEAQCCLCKQFPQEGNTVGKFYFVAADPDRKQQGQYKCFPQMEPSQHNSSSPCTCVVGKQADRREGNVLQDISRME